MGSRRLHLPLQEHNPRHACTKRIHAPLHACAKRRVHLICTRPRDACATLLCVHAQKMRARSKDTWAREEMRASPCSSQRKDARVWAVTGIATQSRHSRSFSPVLPHDQDEREGGIGYKIASSLIS